MRCSAGCPGTSRSSRSCCCRRSWCSSASGCDIRLRPVSSTPLKVRLKSGDVGQRDDRRLLEGRLVVRDRRAVRRADARAVGARAGARRRRERSRDPVGDVMPDAIVPREVAVPAPDVVGADGEPGADLAIDADDELVGRVVLQVRIDRVGRDRVGRVGRGPVAVLARQRLRRSA